MAAALERIVVQTTSLDKKAIAAKARRLDLPMSELMRRGAFAYAPDEADAELAVLADAAEAAASRAGAAIEDALDFIEASNARLAQMDCAATKQRRPVAERSDRPLTRKAA